MGRTDVHAPKALVTEDYEYLGAYDNNPDGFNPAIAKARIELINRVIVEPNRRRADLPGDCQHCGRPYIRYVALMLHKPSNTVLQIGETCLMNRFDRASADFHALRKAAELDRKLMRIRKLVAAFAADPANADLAFMADQSATEARSENYFVRDVAAKLRRYGELSERQIGAVRNALERDAKREEDRRNSPPEPTAVRIPADYLGRTVTVEATILGAKYVDSDFGSNLKALLQVNVTPATAFKLWSTVPAKETHVIEELKGKRVRWTGNITQAPNDPTFGYLSRPRIAK